MQRAGGIKAFVAKPLGKVLLIVVATLALTGSFYYLGPFLSIAVFLLVGLAVPIYLGWKNPRQLAILGVVAILVAGPIISVILTDQFRQPSPWAASSPNAPFGNGQPVLQNAHVDPFTGDPGATYVFSVDLHPENLPNGTTGILWLFLEVSTCPTGLGPASPNCPSGYPYVLQNITFAANGTQIAHTVTFNTTLNGTNIWYWQMAAGVRNLTNQNLTFIFLFPSGGVTATVQGPVTGDFFSTFTLAITSVYFYLFFYVGIPFYVLLLIYTYLKSRERRKKAAAALVATPEETETPARVPGSNKPSAAGAGPAPSERSCPNCAAVVYPNEATCWKCGTSLTGSPGSAPLPSGKT
jgi:hypothetical protein